MHPTDILREAMALAPDDRAKIAAELLDSLDDADAVDEAEWSAAWVPELQSRIRSLEDGSEQSIPADRVFEDIEAHLKEIRRAR